MKDIKSSKFPFRTWFTAFMISVIVSVAIIQARNLGWFQQWDLMAYDLMLNQTLSNKKSNGRSNKKPNDRSNKNSNEKSDQNIIIVAINEKDIQRLQQWPLNDQALATLIQTIKNNGPAAIGIDIYRDILIPPGSDELIATLQKNPNIFLVEKFSTGSLGNAIRPNKALVDESQIGFSDLLIDSDGVVRRGLLFLNDATSVSYALSLRLATTFLGLNQISVGSDPEMPEHLMFGSVPYIPIEKNDGGYVNIDASGYQYFLSLENGRSGFPIYSMGDILSDKNNLDFIRDKIVLVGVISDSVKDSFLTPLNNGRDVTLIPGVVLHAHATSQLITSGVKGSQPLRVLSNDWENIWIIFWALIGLSFAILSTSVFRYIALLSLALIGLIITTRLCFNSGLWLPIAPSLSVFLEVFLLISGYGYIQEKRQRNMIMDIFSRHVSSDVAKQLWAQRDAFFEDGRLKPRQATATILFTDLVGFTSAVEKLDPEELMTWLNDYMEVMANCVIKHGGMIDDYYGDAIKANFGVPLIDNSDSSVKMSSQNAANCALEMNREMQSMNENRLAKEMEPIGMRIGIATGSVIVGSLGSRQRLKYTSIGDVVNIAARLESYGRDAPVDGQYEHCSILLAESTHHYLGDKYKTREIGELQLKGKTKGLKAYQLMVEPSS